MTKQVKNLTMDELTFLIRHEIMHREMELINPCIFDPHRDREPFNYGGKSAVIRTFEDPGLSVTPEDDEEAGDDD